MEKYPITLTQEDGSSDLARGSLDSLTRHEVAKDSEESRAVIRELFQNMQEYASEHGGSYAEIHKVGDSYIPLVALVETDGWGKPDEGLGYVTVDSGHTLAEIYRGHSLYSEEDYSYMSDRVKETQQALEQLGVLDFIEAAGLGSDRNTLYYRGAIERTDEGKYVFTTRKNYSYYRREDSASLEEIIAGLEKLGIETLVLDDNPSKGEEADSLDSGDIFSGKADLFGPDEGSSIEDVGYYNSGAVSSVVTSINSVEIPPENRNRENDALGVLVGISVEPTEEMKEDVLGKYIEKSQEVTLRWAEAPAKDHAMLYEAAGNKYGELLKLPFDDDHIGIAAQYYELDKQQFILFVVECTEEEFEKHREDLLRIAQRTGGDMQRPDDWSDISVELAYRVPGEAWKKIDVSGSAA